MLYIHRHDRTEPALTHVIPPPRPSPPPLVTLYTSVLQKRCLYFFINYGFRAEFGRRDVVMFSCHGATVI
jgi:hypothetical protein